MLKTENNPKVLAAITDVVKQNREAAVQVDEKVSKALASRYSNFTTAAAKKEEVLSEELSPKQKKIAKVAGHPKKIDSADFKALRSGAKVEEETEVSEGNDGNLANNYPPYDKVTKGDVVTGRLGKDHMGGKAKKKLKEMIAKPSQDELDEGRGRPPKNPTEGGGDDKEADQHIHVQLKKASDMSGPDTKNGADVKFDSGTHFVHADHAKKVVSALEKLKPADREKMQAHIKQSHANFQAVHKLVS